MLLTECIDQLPIDLRPEGFKAANRQFVHLEHGYLEDAWQVGEPLYFPPTTTLETLDGGTIATQPIDADLAFNRVLLALPETSYFGAADLESAEPDEATVADSMLTSVMDSELSAVAAPYLERKGVSFVLVGELGAFTVGMQRGHGVDTFPIGSTEVRTHFESIAGGKHLLLTKAPARRSVN